MIFCSSSGLRGMGSALSASSSIRRLITCSLLSSLTTIVSTISPFSNLARSSLGRDFASLGISSSTSILIGKFCLANRAEQTFNDPMRTIIWRKNLYISML
uniref:Uncharacterized protein n=1 Tax=Lepeophtheirus salmonis TaxID=72036 RepID=A0A0K2UGD0_LEPSM